MRLQKCAFSLILVTWVLFSGAAVAQEYPAKTVRIIVPVTAGGGTDALARLLAQSFQKSTGQSFVVENRPGADGMIGAADTARSAPDGYTVLLTTAGIATSSTLHKDLLDPVKDLAPVTLLGAAPLYLVVNPNVPANSVKEFVEYAKKNPGKLNASSSVTGSMSHIVTQLFRQSAGVDFVRVPYKAGADDTTALLSGVVQFGFLGRTGLQGYRQAGKVRVLAISTAKRSAAFPDVPTMSETFPGFDAAQWYALFVPTGTPTAVINKLYTETTKVLNSSEGKAALAAQGIEPAGSTPQEMGAYFKREVDRTTALIKAGLLQN